MLASHRGYQCRLPAGGDGLGVKNDAVTPLPLEGESRGAETGVFYYCHAPSGQNHVGHGGAQ